jgi:hypothetical protein
MATSKKRTAAHNPKRKRGTRPMNVTSHASRLASLRWQASDAHEALTIALEPSVSRYAAQLNALDREVYRMENIPERGPSFIDSLRTAGAKYGRGKLPR